MNSKTVQIQGRYSDLLLAFIWLSGGAVQVNPPVSGSIHPFKGQSIIERVPSMVLPRLVPEYRDSNVRPNKDHQA